MFVLSVIVLALAFSPSAGAACASEDGLFWSASDGSTTLRGVEQNLILKTHSNGCPDSGQIRAGGAARMFLDTNNYVEMGYQNYWSSGSGHYFRMFWETKIGGIVSYSGSIPFSCATANTALSVRIQRATTTNYWDIQYHCPGNPFQTWTTKSSSFWQGRAEVETFRYCGTSGGCAFVYDQHTGLKMRLSSNSWQSNFGHMVCRRDLLSYTGGRANANPATAWDTYETVVADC
jgi:hypothetical protein